MEENLYFEKGLFEQIGNDNKILRDNILVTNYENLLYAVITVFSVPMLDKMRRNAARVLMSTQRDRMLNIPFTVGVFDNISLNSFDEMNATIIKFDDGYEFKVRDIVDTLS